MTGKASLLLIAAFFAVVPAAAQDIAAKPKKPEKICRSTTTTESRMPRRTCHTIEEWDSGKGAALDGQIRNLGIISKTQSDWVGTPSFQ